MSWRETFATRVGPAGLCGITLGDWLRLLCDNRFAVDPPYWLRAGTITGARCRIRVFAGGSAGATSAAIRATQPQPPLFILGIWRSGTTHLHNLLARDARFAYPEQLRGALSAHVSDARSWFNAPFLSRIIPAPPAAGQRARWPWTSRRKTNSPSTA